MCFDDELRGCGLETYTTLDANDGVAHIGITTDGIRGTNLLDFLDGFHAIVIFLSVDTNDLALFKLNLQ